MTAKPAEQTKQELKKQMERIRDLWNHYFLDYQSLSRMIRYPNNTNHKYVGTILGNFIDTFDVIYKPHLSNSYALNMSLMQSIYMQQDFIEELLHIFECGISKGDLKNDDNYNINRDIRNELMGHPIRKIRGELISTTLHAYNGPKECINYMRYHKDNNFSFEMMSFNIEEIVSRHTEFMSTYFEKIIVRISVIMKSFICRLRHIDSISYKIEFPRLLDFVFRCFEAIEKREFIYDKESLNKIYEKRNDHIRYHNLIDCFYSDLKESINGHLENLDEIFNPKGIELPDLNYEPPKIVIKIIKGLLDDNEDELDSTLIESNQKRSYHYELGKLCERDALFMASYNILKNEFSSNNLILEELENMKNNKYDDIEYFCSYRLVCQEVEKYEVAFL